MIPQEILKEALLIVGRALPEGRAALPITSHILLATEGPGTLRLSATNLDMSIHCWIGGEWDNPIAIAVPGRIFIDLISTLPPGPVSLHQVDRLNLIVSSGRSRSTLHGMDAADFPPIQEIPGPEHRVAITTAFLLKSAIDRVAFAAADDDARPTLSSVLIRQSPRNEHDIILAAADGYRLAMTMTVGARGQFSILLPIRAAREVARICGRVDKKYDDDPQAEIRLPADGSRAFIILEPPEDTPQPMRVLIVSSLVPGNFPDYEHLIPNSREASIAIEPRFKQACEIAMIFARELESSPVTIIGNDRNTRIVSSSPWLGDVQISLDKLPDGLPFEIIFNAKYLLDALNTLDDPMVIFELASTKYGPGVIRTDYNRFVYVVMPMLDKEEQ